MVESRNEEINNMNRFKLKFDNDAITDTELDNLIRDAFKLLNEPPAKPTEPTWPIIDIDQDVDEGWLNNNNDWQW
jgi:hypothetical protein